MRPKSTRTARVCPQCGATFVRKASLPFRYCSGPCYRAHRRRPLHERFWEKVNKNGPIPEHVPELGPCWLWTAGTDGKYGSFGTDEGHVKAHRQAYELLVGPIPGDCLLLHRCHRTHCVNPLHLTPGSYSQNLIERYRFGRSSDTPDPRPAQSRIEIPCQYCGLFFVVGAKEEQRRKYCSYPCSTAARYGTDPIARFWSKVEKTKTCWLWTGALHEYGYGLLTWGDKQTTSHRVAWELLRGSIPDGLLVCHDCPGGENPRCCRPDHMFLGTHVDNARDCSRKGRSTKGRRNAHPERQIRGEACPWAKLNEEIVRSIRLRSAAGETQVAISATLGVTPSLIGCILRGKAWAHVK